VWADRRIATLCGLVGGVVHGVTLGCVNGDPEIEIGRHIFVGSKAAWEVIPDGVTTFDEGAPGEPQKSDFRPENAKVSIVE
jgi:hypothetical protein